MSSPARDYRIRLPQPWRETTVHGPSGPLVAFSRRFQKPTGLEPTNLVRLEMECLDDWPQTVQLNGDQLALTAEPNPPGLGTVLLESASLQATNELVISFASPQASPHSASDGVSQLDASLTGEPLFGRRFLKGCTLVIF